MTQVIVNRKVIEVNKKHCQKTCSASLLPRYRLLPAIHKQVSVWQSGQKIVMNLMSNCIQLMHVAGDIGEDTDVMSRIDLPIYFCE